MLQPAALWLHQKEKRTRATANELAPVIEPAIKAVGWPHGSAADFLKAVRDESGLLTGWDQEHYGFMHLGFQEYLAAREIRRRAFSDSAVLRELASHFGESWWREVGLLLLALEEPSLFTPYMREVVKQSAFAKHSDLVAACLDDAAEVSIAPFRELIESEAGKDAGLWERQLTALRVAEQLDEEIITKLIPSLRNHPGDKIRQWAQERSDRMGMGAVVAARGG